MIDYILNKPTRFDGGTVIGLSIEQAKDRIRNLESAGEDIYKVLSPIMMKAGELVKLADLPKGIADRFDRPGEAHEDNSLVLLGKDDLEEFAHTLQQRSEELSKAESEIAVRKEELVTAENALNDELDRMDEREAKLDERERLLNLREDGLNEREKAMDAPDGQGVNDTKKKQGKSAK